MRFLITAGPTREPIDPVRFLSNRSSGKMGHALAEAARAAGHDVVLISGPVNLTAPAGVTCIPVETAAQMLNAVRAHLGGTDVAIFAAAVADYRPAQASLQKIKKTGETLTLTLERTEDILGAARSALGFTGFLVGFAAETENLIANAMDKLARKGCDLVIANDVSKAGTGFDSDENEVTLCLPGGATVPLPRQPKSTLARSLIDTITRRAANRAPQDPSSPQ